MLLNVVQSAVDRQPATDPDATAQEMTEATEPITDMGFEKEIGAVPVRVVVATLPNSSGVSPDVVQKERCEIVGTVEVPTLPVPEPLPEAVDEMVTLPLDVAIVTFEPAVSVFTSYRPVVSPPISI